MKKGLTVFSLLVVLLAAITSFAEESPKGTITGKWVTKSGPIGEAQVSLFNVTQGPPPAQGRQSFRAADEMGSTKGDGSFSLEVPAGKYYLGMTKHSDGSLFGPPREGELHFFGQEKGKPKVYLVKPGRTTNVGTISEGTPFKKASGSSVTAIEGRVADEAGQPVPGVLVFAFSDQNMDGKPLYVSEKTGPDGSYRLIVAEGEYYLKIRNSYGGGQPEAGEMLGGYGDFDDPAAVVVKKGEVSKGIDITAKRFPGRGQRDAD